MKKILFILMLFPLLLVGQIINTKPVVGMVEDVETLTLTHNDSTKSIIKKVNIVTVSTFASNSAVMILLNGADNTQQYYTIRPSQLLYPVVTAQGLVDSLVAWLNISGGGSGGSGVTDFVLEDGYNLVLTAGSVFTVPINEITVGTFGSYTGIVDGDSLSFFGRQVSGGAVYGLNVLEDSAKITYVNADGSSSTLQVKDTLLSASHVRSDNVISSLSLTPNMGGITHINSNSDITFFGVDSTRATINHQNPNGTEAYGYFNDVSAQVGYKNGEADRRYLLADSNFVSLFANDGVDSTTLRVELNSIYGQSPNGFLLGVGEDFGAGNSSALAYSSNDTFISVFATNDKVQYYFYDTTNLNWRGGFANSNRTCLEANNPTGTIINTVCVRDTSILIQYQTAIDDEVIRLDANGTDIESDVLTLLSPNILTPSILTVASTSLDQATQATDDPAGYAAVTSGSLYKNSDNIIFWKP